MGASSMSPKGGRLRGRLETRPLGSYENMQISFRYASIGERPYLVEISMDIRREALRSARDRPPITNSLDRRSNRAGAAVRGSGIQGHRS